MLQSVKEFLVDFAMFETEHLFLEEISAFGEEFFQQQSAC
jgi:hypothetical protein